MSLLERESLLQELDEDESLPLDDHGEGGPATLTHPTGY